MPLEDVERLILEDSIVEAQMAADKYLQTRKPIHAKMLKHNIDQCFEILDEYKTNLLDDDERDKYKLHLFVPTHLNELLKMRELYES